MENKLPIQEKSNNTDKMLDKRNQVITKIKDNLNFIYVGLLIIANILVSLLVIDEGHLKVVHPTTFLGWVLWAVQIILETVIGVLILNAFRRQGVKDGFKHKEVQDLHKKYLELYVKISPKKPRSLKEYLGKHARIDSLSKSIIYITVSIFVGDAIISANWNNLISLITNIIFAVAFGIKAMIDAEDYVINELVIWYQLKIAEVTDQKLEPAKEKTKKCRDLTMKASTTLKEMPADKLNLTSEKTLNKTND